MRILTEKTVAASAEDVWTLLGERFGEIGTWADAVVDSKLDRDMSRGAIRTCELKPTSVGSGTIREEVIVFDRSDQSVGFKVIEGVPGFMRLVQNIYTVKDIGPGMAQVKSDLHVKVAWYMTPMLPIIRNNFRKLIGGFIDELGQKA